MNAADLTIWLVAGAGVLSFISPCSLPLYPSYLSYITGVSIQDLKRKSWDYAKNQRLYIQYFFMIGFFGYILRVRFIGKLDWNNIFI